MEALKTLEDIEVLLIPKDMDNCPSVVIDCFKKELKQEAIKWVKHLKIHNNKSEKLIVIKEGDYGVAAMCGASGVFIDFFNITEDDLT